MRSLSIALRAPVHLSHAVVVGAVAVTSVASVLVVQRGRQDFSLVEAQVEGAAIKTNLGGLRTAYAIDHLAQTVASGGQPVDAMHAMVLQPNPFLLLHRMPGNYVGEMRSDDVANLAPGSWMFDPACPCLAYRPRYPRWLTSPSGSDVLWFDLRREAAGPWLLTSREHYPWKGELLD